MPTDLRDAVAEAIVSHEWDDFPRSAHGDHNYYGACAICQGDVPRIAEVALAALLEDPGDLPDRMSDAIDDAIISGDDYNPVKAANAAMSVRDELVAHLSARAAMAEARVGHAEAGAQLSSERLAKVRQELAAAATVNRGLRPALESAEAETGRLRVHLKAQRQEAWLYKTRADEADTAIAALRDLRETLATSAKRLTRREITRQFDAALDAPALRALDSKEILSSSTEVERDALKAALPETTTTPARETA